MFRGKNKAITFSYDDGVTQDKRLIDIFDKCGLKATFNLNSKLLGLSGELVRDRVRINHTKNSPEEIKEIYKNHEVAAHTLTHPLLTELSDEEIIYQVETDRKNLERLIDKPVIGMAYPEGGINYNKRVARVIQENTGIKYARTTISSYNFDLQTDLYAFKPTVYHHQDWKEMIELGKKFITLKTSTPKIFYIWGHSYEFDINDSWVDFEKFCRMISEKDDIFYGTNSEVIL